MSKSYDIEQYFVDLPTGNLRVSEIGEVLEILRGQGSAELQVSGKIPMSIRAIFDVGPGGAADDLWDLRDLFNELNDQLGGYGDNPRDVQLDKPERVA
jgi:hypothetical protein